MVKKELELWGGHKTQIIESKKIEGEDKIHKVQENLKNLNNFIAKTSSEKPKKKKKVKDVIAHDDLDENGQWMYNLPR